MKVSQPVSVNGNRQYMSKEPDPQVIPKAERRKFSAEYKLRILAAPSGPPDECTERGQIGALLRREGSTHPIWTSGASNENAVLLKG